MRYQHFGWPVSPYAAKTRAYFRFKEIPFEDIEPDALKLFVTIRRAVGRPVMPTVRSGDGTWLQDTSEIIDTLERAHPTPSITPEGARQRITSLLLELHADEWLPIVAMYTRWVIVENRRFATEAFGAHGFPYLPRFVSRRLVRPIADKMSSYLPVLGVSDETHQGIEAFLQGLISQLNVHLETHPFLLGTRPCLGDFALYGPLWAHCYRDPGSRHFFSDTPAVVAWFERLANPGSETGQFLENDVVPKTLDPILRTLFADQWPYVATVIQEIDAWCQAHPDAPRVPRALGSCPFTIGGSEGERRLLTFTQWMAQRPLEAYTALGDEDRASVDAWLDRLGGREAMQRAVTNPLERHHFKMRLVRP